MGETYYINEVPISEDNLKKLMDNMPKDKAIYEMKDEFKYKGPVILTTKKRYAPIHGITPMDGK